MGCCKICNDPLELEGFRFSIASKVFTGIYVWGMKLEAAGFSIYKGVWPPGMKLPRHMVRSTVTSICVRVAPQRGGPNTSVRSVETCCVRWSVLENLTLPNKAKLKTSTYGLQELLSTSSSYKKLLLQSLEYEARNQYINSKGKNTHFATFLVGFLHSVLHSINRGRNCWIQEPGCLIIW